MSIVTCYGYPEDPDKIISLDNSTPPIEETRLRNPDLVRPAKLVAINLLLRVSDISHVWCNGDTVQVWLLAELLL